MRNSRFPVRKAGIFSSGKEIEELRGDVQKYAAQENPKIDAARGKKHPFRTETKIIIGAPDRIRTCDHRLRRHVLYPAELQARMKNGVYCKATCLKGCIKYQKSADNAICFVRTYLLK